jgi:hypothetical protein
MNFQSLIQSNNLAILAFQESDFCGASQELKAILQKLGASTAVGEQCFCTPLALPAENVLSECMFLHPNRLGSVEEWTKDTRKTSNKVSNQIYSNDKEFFTGGIMIGSDIYLDTTTISAIVIYNMGLCLHMIATETGVSKFLKRSLRMYHFSLSLLESILEITVHSPILTLLASVTCVNAANLHKELMESNNATQIYRRLGYYTKRIYLLEKKRTVFECMDFINKILLFSTFPVCTAAPCA